MWAITAQGTCNRLNSAVKNSAPSNNKLRAGLDHKLRINFLFSRLEIRFHTAKTQSRPAAILRRSPLSHLSVRS